MHACGSNSTAVTMVLERGKQVVTVPISVHGFIPTSMKPSTLEETAPTYDFISTEHN